MRFVVIARALSVLSASFVLAFTRPAGAAEPSGSLESARAAFKEGASFAKDAQWGAALAAFETSSGLFEHAWTTYNIAVCERALGRYVRARQTFRRALEQRGRAGDLPASTVLDVERFIAEIDALVANVEVVLSPADAVVSVDGQPLEVQVSGPEPILALGSSPRDRGRPPPAPKFRVLLDPGAHIFLISRAGFADAMTRVSLGPGEKQHLDLVADRLPATLSVSANKSDAVVTVNAIDVGVAPVRLTRPPGRYHVLVRRPGFVPYESDAVLAPGQSTDLRATLKAEEPGLLSRWWFWTAAGVVVAGAAITTYALTRPEPERPPYDGGGLGWTAKVP